MDDVYVCPNCNKEIIYSSRCNYLRAKRKSVWCKKCSANKPDRINKIGAAHLGKKRPDWWCDRVSKSKMGHAVSAETRKKISIASTGRKLSETHKNKIRDGNKKSWTPERKKQYRLYTINKIQKEKLNGNQLYPAFNSSACKLIDDYGSECGYNFQHAMNGGEFYISTLGYWVDGYDKEKNVVIEVDEKKHFDASGNLREKDIIRQEEISNFLKCKFIRLKFLE